MSDNVDTVLFTSDSSGNPYHHLLFEALENCEVNILQKPIPYILPLTRAIIKNDSVDIIHLDWLYKFYMVDDFTQSVLLNTIITAIRTINFILDLLFVKVLRVKIVWTVHNKYHHERRYFLIEWATNIIVGNVSDSITVKCDSAKKTISRIYKITDPSKIYTVPDGNYIHAYRSDMQKNIGEFIPESNNKFIYLYFGSIRPYKGVKRLIRVFHSINVKNAELWIVGNPMNESIGKEIYQLASRDERVHTRLEYIPDEEVQYYMNGADVLVLPYQDILNSGTVYLGMSFGKPIIAPSIGCIPNTVHEENDLLYEHDSDRELGLQLRKARRKDLSDISRANKDRASQYSWENIAEKYVKIYNLSD